jgi:hypothetical protein
MTAAIVRRSASLICFALSSALFGLKATAPRHLLPNSSTTREGTSPRPNRSNT